MTLIIAAAQSSSVPGGVAENVTRHLRFGAAAAEHGVQLLVFPELSLTAYVPAIARANALRADASSLDPLRRLAEQAKMTVVAGAPVVNDDGGLHIAAFAFRPDGSVSTYMKVHLGDSEKAIFTPGPGGPMLSVGDADVALAICADTTHPEHAAGAVARGANIYAAGALITPDAYPRDSAFLNSYAREHRMAVLLANYSVANGDWVSAGRSAIWSEDGNLVVASTGTEEELVVGKRQNGVWHGIVTPVPFPVTATW